MSKENSTYHLIEAYLDGELSKEEVHVLEKRMDQDSNFKNYVEDHKVANQLIVEAELINIKSTLQHLHTQEKKSFFNKKVLLIISVIALFLIGLIVFKLNKTKEFEGEKSPAVINLPSKVDKKDILIKTNVEREVEKPLSVKSDSSKVKNQTKGLPLADSSSNTFIDAVLLDTIDNVVEVNVSDQKNSNIVKTNKVDSLLAFDEPIDNEVPCIDFKIESDVEVSSSCENTYEGQIELTSVVGDYTYSINGGYSSSKSGLFKQLKPAWYTIYAIDDKGCKSSPLVIQVEAEICDFIIQPSQQVFWDIPLSSFDEDRVTLEIYDGKSGQKVDSRLLDKFSIQTWKGESINGELLPMGSYVYLLISKSKQMKGNITIVR